MSSGTFATMTIWPRFLPLEGSRSLPAGSKASSTVTGENQLVECSVQLLHGDVGRHRPGWWLLQWDFPVSAVAQCRGNVFSSTATRALGIYFNLIRLVTHLAYIALVIGQCIASAFTLVTLTEGGYIYSVFCNSFIRYSVCGVLPVPPTARLPRILLERETLWPEPAPVKEFISQAYPIP